MLSDSWVLIHSRLSTTGTRTSYGITQFYLPPNRGEVHPVTPVEAGTRFIDPVGITVLINSPKQDITHIYSGQLNPSSMQTAVVINVYQFQLWLCMVGRLFTGESSDQLLYIAPVKPSLMSAVPPSQPQAFYVLGMLCQAPYAKNECL